MSVCLGFELNFAGIFRTFLGKDAVSPRQYGYSLGRGSMCAYFVLDTFASDLILARISTVLCSRPQ